MSNDSECRRLREEVDRLRDFILGPDVELSRDAYARFMKIESYALRDAQRRAAARAALPGKER